VPPVAPGTSRVTLSVCLLSVWIIWGSVYLAIRLVIEEADPFQAMAQRFLVAGLLLATIAFVRRGWSALRVSRRQLGALLVTGFLLLGLGNGLTALAQVHGLPSGVTALVVASVPAWAVVVRSSTGDVPSPATLVGVAVGFVGLAVLVALGQGLGTAMPLIGVGLCLVASLSWTIGSYLQGVVGVPSDLFTVAGYQQLVAAGSSVVLASATGETFSLEYSLRGWLALGYLVVACSVAGFLAYAWLLQNVPLSLTATHAYVNPVVAVLLGWWVLDEQVGLPVLLGGGTVLVAVVVILRAERTPPAAATPTTSPPPLPARRPE